MGSTSYSGSGQSSQATSLTSLRPQSQTTGSTSNMDMDSAQTSQTNLTSEAASDVNVNVIPGHTVPDLYQHSLPKPTWPTTLELRGSYYEDPAFIDWGCQYPMLHSSVSARCSFSRSSADEESVQNIDEPENTVNLKNRGSALNPANLDLHLEEQESGPSNPISPVSSSMKSSTSSLSDRPTTVSQMRNSVNEQQESSSSDNTQKMNVSESCRTKTYSASKMNFQFGCDDQLKSIVSDETKSHSQRDVDLNLVSKSDSETRDASDTGDDSFSELAKMKSKLSLPLVKVYGKNFTYYLRPRAKTCSHSE